jgi:hypothetical protein
MTIIGDIETWGLIPGFLDESDPRSAKEQFHANYRGGWHPVAKLSWEPATETLHYPGDPPMRPIGAILFGDEVLLMFPGAFVMVVQPDGRWEVARMD